MKDFIKVSIVSCVLFLISLVSFSQGEFNTWYFGTHAGISFNSGNPVALPSNPMVQLGTQAGASVSDSIGNILFYSNGKKV